MPASEFWTTLRHDDPTASWREMLSATHLPWNVAATAGEAAFHAWVRRTWIDDLALLDCGCDPCAGTRRRPQMADTDGEFVIILINRAGREVVGQDDSEAQLSPGDAVAWVSTKAAWFHVSAPLVKRSLVIPRAALDEVGMRAQLTTGIRLHGAAPATRLLTGYLDTLAGTAAGLGAAGRTAARNAALDLVAAALATAAVPTAATTHPALRATMDRYIERHLLDDALVSPGAIALAHGVSTRTVNRIFHEAGQTVGEVVRLRRLARAREELLHSERSIATIAHRWGFADSSHFSRWFKAQYGCPPTDYRAAIGPTDGHANGAPVPRGVAVVRYPAGRGPDTEPPHVPA